MVYDYGLPPALRRSRLATASYTDSRPAAPAERDLAAFDPADTDLEDADIDNLDEADRDDPDERPTRGQYGPSEDFGYAK